MPADIILEDQSVRIKDGDLHVEGGIQINKGDDVIDINRNHIRVKRRGNESRIKGGVISTDKTFSGKVTTKKVVATAIQAGTGNPGEPGEPGVLTLEDGHGAETVHFQAKHGNMKLGGEGADGDIWLKDQEGNYTIELDAGSGERKFSSTRVFVDGKRGDLRLAGETRNLSDARCKENVESLGGALEKVVALRGVTFNWKEGKGCPETDGRRIGLIAQEVKEVLPEAVSEDTEGIHSLTYTSLIPVLIEAVKEQQCTLVAQDARLNEMEERLETMEAALSQSEVPVQP
jgi:hypothetical protein